MPSGGLGRFPNNLQGDAPPWPLIPSPGRQGKELWFLSWTQEWSVSLQITLQLVMLPKQWWLEDDVVGLDSLKTKFLKKSLSVMKGKHCIRSLVTEFRAWIGIDMVHHEIDLFLGVLTDILAFGYHSSYELMVILAGTLLVWRGGIAVKHPWTAVTIRSKLKCFRIWKLRAVVCLMPNSA